MEHKIIKIKLKEERRLVASILFANGYTVKETVIIDGKTKRTALEYWDFNSKNENGEVII